MDAAQRVGETRKFVARKPRRILPFRQLRQALERKIDGLADLVRTQPLGQRIDRIDQRQLGEALGVDDAIGMQHLQMAVIEGRGAGDVAEFAFGQAAFADSPSSH